MEVGTFSVSQDSAAWENCRIAKATADAEASKNQKLTSLNLGMSYHLSEINGLYDADMLVRGKAEDRWLPLERFK